MGSLLLGGFGLRRVVFWVNGRIAGRIAGLGAAGFRDAARVAVEDEA